MEDKQFFESIYQLSSGEKAALKRNCGSMLEQADGNAILAFYKCLPYGVPKKQEPYWFAAACIASLFKEPGNKPIEQVFSELKNESNSIEMRIAGLIDMNWDEDGYFLQKLTRLIKMSVQKGYTVDCSKLLGDLIYWNNDTRSVQKKWARALYIKKNVEGEE